MLTISRSYSDLRPYQREAIDRIYEYDHNLILVKVGGGKTVIAASAAAELLDAGVVDRVLVVAPKRVSWQVWPDEFRIWEHLKEYTLNVAVGAPAKRRAAFETPSDFVVVNWENLSWAYDEGLLDGFGMVIMDEVSYAQGYGSQRNAVLQKLRGVPLRVGLTGSPGTIKRLFGMVRTIDRGRRLGHTWTKFRNDYYDKVGPNPWDWQERDGAMDEVLDNIDDLAFVLKPEDYENQLPPLVNTNVFVELPPRAREIYNDIEHKMVAAIGDVDLEALLEIDPDHPDIITAANRGVVTGKLQQIVDGFMYQDDGFKHLHDEKMDALAERIAADPHPVMVAYKFRETLARLQEEYRDGAFLTAQLSEKRTMGIIDAWNRGEIPQLFIHPQSAAHGLNLQFGGNRLIILSCPWSREYYEQTIGRLQRSGQEAPNVFVEHIMVRASVDEDIAMAQIRNESRQKKLLEGILERG